MASKDAVCICATTHQRSPVSTVDENSVATWLSPFPDIKYLEVIILHFLALPLGWAVSTLPIAEARMSTLHVPAVNLDLCHVFC